jgi:glutamate carboxypeptidase
MSIEKQRLEDAFLDDLRRLVSVDCGTDNKAGVDEVGDIFQEMLERGGFSVECVKQSVYGDFRIGRIHGSGTKKIMLIGHLDTVYPIGTVAGRPMSIEGDIVKGPGVADIKGGLLVALYAVQKLIKQGFSNFKEIVLFANSEEEFISPVSRNLYAPIAKEMDAVLVFESGGKDGRIVSARNGAGEYTITVQGHAAHAGVEPEKGINAILELAHKILELQTIPKERPGILLNVGIIEGGARPNVVPERAIGIIDVRARQNDIIPYIQSRFKEIASTSSVAGSVVSIEGEFRFPAMERNAQIEKLVQCIQTAGAELGLQIKEEMRGGSSDANFIASLGVPVVDGLGPVGGDDHSEREYILRSSIVERIELVGRVIRKIGEGEF